MEEFVRTSEPNMHIGRCREILKKYPEVRDLMGVNRWTALCAILIVILQLSLAKTMATAPLWVILLVAYTVGAISSHATYSIQHECTHDLVFKKSNNNRLLGLFCDWILCFPSFITFRTYHTAHHIYLGERDRDVDLVNYDEVRLIGTSPIKKMFWLMFFPIFQVYRTYRLRNMMVWSKWAVANYALQITVNVLIIVFLGPWALVYLFFSAFFGLGPHPVGGRWLQEHYVHEKDSTQETNSYYGPLNYLSFNVGYHTEHHDIMNIPWNRLPKLKKLAAEYYDSLYSYQSWVGVIFSFIFDKDKSPASRVMHTG